MVQLHYVLEFPQEPVKNYPYIKIIDKFELDTKEDTTEHVLKIHNTMYIQKKSVRVWYQHLVVNITKKILFTHSTVYKFIFIEGKKCMPCTQMN